MVEKERPWKIYIDTICFRNDLKTCTIDILIEPLGMKIRNLKARLYKKDGERRLAFDMPSYVDEYGVERSDISFPIPCEEFEFIKSLDEALYQEYEDLMIPFLVKALQR